jgi:hypothetical protein
MSDAAARLARLRDDVAARLAAARTRASSTAAPPRSPPVVDGERLERTRARLAAARARSDARANRGGATTVSSRLVDLGAAAREAARSAAAQASSTIARRRATMPTTPPSQPALRVVVVVVVVVALLAWLLRGACEPAPVPPPTATPVCATCPEAPLCVPPVRVARPTPPRRAKAKIPPTPREALDIDNRAPPPWLERFRRQVMARSTILAACFAGSERPGAAWWTARFDPTTGAATEGRLEPVQGGPPLSTTQEQCVLRGLQDTRYALGDVVDADPTARRLRLLLEF